MKSAPRPWTPQDVVELEKLKGRFSAAEIGKMLGRTKNSIIGKLHQKAPKKKEYKRPEKIRAGLKRNETLVRVVDIPTEAPEGQITLLKAGLNQCRYPSEESAHIVCGCQTIPDSSYCADHYKKTHVKTDRYRAGGVEFCDKTIVRYKV